MDEEILREISASEKDLRQTDERIRETEERLGHPQTLRDQECLDEEEGNLEDWRAQRERILEQNRGAARSVCLLPQGNELPPSPQDFRGRSSQLPRVAAPAGGIRKLLSL